MRRSVQPNCPRAMTCCFFASLKILAMSAERLTALPPRQRLERLLPMAGFQVSIYGRFWVSTEVSLALLYMKGFKSFWSIVRLCEARLSDDAAVVLRSLFNLLVIARWIGLSKKDRASWYMMG